MKMVERKVRQPIISVLEEVNQDWLEITFDDLSPPKALKTTQRGFGRGVITVAKRFSASICFVKKRDNSYSSIAIIKRDTTAKLEVQEGDGILLRSGRNVFPTITAKRRNSKGSFSYSFSIPLEVAKSIKHGKYHCFSLLSKSLPRECAEERNVKTISPLEFLPQVSIRGAPFHVFDLGDKLLVWISERANKYAILPKRIGLRDGPHDLLELFGAFFCEGRRARRSNRHHLDVLSFSNTDGQQISWFVDGVEKFFGVSKDSWDLQVLCKRKSSKLIAYWSQLGFKSEKIRLYENTTVSAPHGVSILFLYGTTFAEVFYELMTCCKKLALREEQNSLSFFRGISRGDIGVLHRKENGFLSAVNYSTGDRADADFFCELCKRLNLTHSRPLFCMGKKYKKGYWSVFITGHKNFRRLIELGAITHPKRKRELIEGFLRSKKSTTFKYLDAVSNGANTASKAADSLGVSVITSRATFQKLRDAGYLESGSVFDRYNPKIHTITSKGAQLLGFYQKLEKEVM